jgi:long-chain acyl-CoA synthetase
VRVTAISQAWILRAADLASRSPTQGDFAQLGIVAGDRVCISAPNSPELLAVISGCLASGIAPAVISASSTEREISEMSADIQVSVLLRDADIHALATPTEREPGNDQLPRCRPIHFTSGTSGRPKAVWSGWLTDEHVQEWIADETVAWGLSDADTHLVCGPLNHSAPLRFALMTLWNGGTVVVPPAFDAETATGLLTHVTTTFMAPAHMQRLMDLNQDSPMPHTLRLLAHAGSSCPERVRRWAHTTFGLDAVFEFYGSTEGQWTMCPARDWEQRPGTVGRARAGRAIRTDADDQLWCRVPEHARFTYWGDPEKTKAAWQDSWFTVGDLGSVDVDGYVFLQGRAGDLIITGGVNVYPAEIERVLTELPGLRQCVAFGLPDERWGERVCIAVTGDVSEEQISEFVTAQLSGPKRPKSIYLVDALPLTHSGKINRTVVPALFAQGDYS